MQARIAQCTLAAALAVAFAWPADAADTKAARAGAQASTAAPAVPAGHEVRMSKLIGMNVVNPQGWINPEGATATACSGCHVAKDAAAHFLAMTSSLGESCTVCHQSGAAFDVDQVHAE